MKKKIFKSDFLRSKINDYLTHLQRTPVKTVIVFTQHICKKNHSYNLQNKLLL